MQEEELVSPKASLGNDQKLFPGCWKGQNNHSLSFLGIGMSPSSLLLSSLKSRALSLEYTFHIVGLKSVLDPGSVTGLKWITCLDGCSGSRAAAPPPPFRTCIEADRQT